MQALCGEVNYSKVEAGKRKLSVTTLAKVAKHFGRTLDELVNFKGKVPAEEKIEDKATMEQLKLINGLDEDDKAMVFRLIDTIVTKKKVQRFCRYYAVKIKAVDNIQTAAKTSYKKSVAVYFWSLIPTHRCSGNNSFVFCQIAFTKIIICSFFRIIDM
jgi:arsenate reductase-like glutaredoxin family protein